MGKPGSLGMQSHPETQSWTTVSPRGQNQGSWLAEGKDRISPPGRLAGNAELWSEWMDWFSGTVFSAGAKGWKYALAPFFLWLLWEVA